MASAFSHIAVPITLRWILGKRRVPIKVVLWGLFLSIMPDFDSIGFRFGVPYASQWGHRGFTHSIVFAIMTAIVSVAFCRLLSSRPATMFLVSFTSVISHSLLDACTSGGLGVAFFWPFTDERFFFPWREIQVSPMSVSRFFGDSGWPVLKSELKFIWAPCFLMGCISFFFRSLLASKSKSKLRN